MAITPAIAANTAPACAIVILTSTYLQTRKHKHTDIHDMHTYAAYYTLFSAYKSVFNCANI